MFRKKIKNQDGSALLISLLLMGILTSVSLILASLVLRQLRITTWTIDSGKAYYSAESAIEVALYKLETSLAGFETPSKKYLPLSVSGKDNDVVAEYRIDNTCSAYPCFDDSYDKKTAENDDLSKFYKKLDLNESITIPLFVVGFDENGEFKKIPVKNFTVEFYAVINPSHDFKMTSVNLAGWDMLNWKIYGYNDATKRTDSISDFTALSMQNLGDEDASFSTNFKNPSWFGTMDCGDGRGRYTDKIECLLYTLGENRVQRLKVEGQESEVFAGMCDNTQAREFYNYGDDKKLDVEDIWSCYPIKSFLDDHKYNYLTLTNLMNPSVLNGDFTLAEKNAKSALYYRIEFFDEKKNASKGVRDSALITANGYSGDSVKNISVKVKRGEFMPVFNFSLYSTYKSDRE